VINIRRVGVGADKGVAINALNHRVFSRGIVDRRVRRAIVRKAMMITCRILPNDVAAADAPSLALRGARGTV
jgi:hypothetical protein